MSIYWQQLKLCKKKFKKKEKLYYTGIYSDYKPRIQKKKNAEWI